jgi:hypothetical protein
MPVFSPLLSPPSSYVFEVNTNKKACKSQRFAGFG